MSSLDPGPIDLRDYAAVLWARKWTILAVVTTATLAAGWYSYHQTPTYTATAEVVVRPIRFDPNEPPTSFGFSNMQTEQRLAMSATVADLAADDLARLGVDPGTISVTIVEDAEILVFTSSSPDPASARWTAQTYAKSYLDFRQTRTLTALEAARTPYEGRLQVVTAQLRRIARELDETNDPVRASVLNTRYSALLEERTILDQRLDELVSPEALDVGQIIRDARLPTSPSAPDHVKDVGVGFVVGLALAVAVAFIRERFDDRPRGRRELEVHSGAPVLAFVPRMRHGTKEPITLTAPMSDTAEAYRALRVRLLQAASEQKFKTILVTSSLDGEGKSSTTANLGVALALAGKRVVLVSGDLRRPALHEIFPVETKGGLTDVLARRNTILEALAFTGTENLWLLDTGTRDSVSPLEVLGSDAMRDLLAELRSFADLVLIDSPPVLTTPDVVALAPVVDAVLFVADPRRVERLTIQEARHELGLTDVEIIGVVVSKFSPRRFRAYGHGYGYHRYAADVAPHHELGDGSHNAHQRDRGSGPST